MTDPEYYKAPLRDTGPYAGTVRRRKLMLPIAKALGQVRGATVSRVRRFWEKPAASRAEALYRQGCLWNILLLVGHAEGLVALFEAFTPELMCAFDPIRRALGSAREATVVRDVYATLPASISRR